MISWNPMCITRHERSMLALLAGLMILQLLVGGCAPRVRIRSNPGPGDTGLRYYRPKPYLKVEPAEVAIEKNQTTIVPGLVRISLAYLPDFSEEYAIDVRSGLGTAQVDIKLEDGWNLTEIGQDLDSQTDENLRAVSSLLGAVGDVLPTAAGANNGTDASFTLPARNVPIGFYESIIGRDARGCKRLYGFRYVGFLPYSNCPIDMGGHQSMCCGEPAQIMYGLVFRDNQMVFQPLDAMAVDSSSQAASTNQTATSELPGPVALAQEMSPEGAAPTEIDFSQLTVGLRTHLLSIADGIGEVRAGHQQGRLVVHIQIAPETLGDPVRRAAEQWLETAYPGIRNFDVRLDHRLPPSLQP